MHFPFRLYYSFLFHTRVYAICITLTYEIKFQRRKYIPEAQPKNCLFCMVRAVGSHIASNLSTCTSRARKLAPSGSQVRRKRKVSFSHVYILNYYSNTEGVMPSLRDPLLFTFSNTPAATTTVIRYSKTHTRQPL